VNYECEPSVIDVFYTMTPISDFYLYGCELVYVYTSKIFAYDFELYCYDFLNLMAGYTNDFFFNILLDICYNLSSCHLFFSIIADFIISTSIYKHYFNTEWYKMYISHQTISLFIIYHPELSIHFQENSETFLKNYGLSFISNFDLISTSAWISPTVQLIDMMILFYGFIGMFLFYFSCLIAISKENNTVDSDYLSAWLVVESEKEVGSFDDILLGLLIVIQLFGWFFYVYVWNFLAQYPELIMLFYITPFLIFIMIGVPFSLIYDFGLCFLVYIRGGSANQMFLPELIYDYINVGAFFLRLCLQIVRIFLMFLTYCAMCDVFFFNHDLGRGLGGFEEIWNDTANMGVNMATFFYIICDIFPRIVIRFIFEIGHTIAVCSIQYFAFFAIVFWFFLFLYTFFCAVKLEAYFWEKRNNRKIMINNYIKNKN